MAQLGSIKIEVTIEGPDGIESHIKETRYFTPVTTANAGRRKVSLTGSAFTALTIPTGATLLVIDPGAATGLTLKGITGDTGVAMVPTSLPPGMLAVIPLGTTPSVGINNAGSTAVIDVWSW